MQILTIRNPPKGLVVWNFILECRHIITKHNSWHIENGEKASFWHDSWNRMGRLANLEGVENFIPIL